MKNILCILLFSCFCLTVISCGTGENLSNSTNTITHTDQITQEQEIINCYSVKNSKNDNSTIDNSTVSDSSVSNSIIYNSIISNSIISNSIIKNETLINVTISNSSINNSR